MLNEIKYWINNGSFFEKKEKSLNWNYNSNLLEKILFFYNVRFLVKYNDFFLK
jgi:hypothetical protein